MREPASTESQAWIGTCQFDRDSVQAGLDSEGQATSLYRVEGLAAAYCINGADYAAKLRTYGEARGLRLIWCEGVLPAGHWIARHPKQRDLGGDLARTVNPGIPVTLGPLTTLSSTAPPTAEAEADDPQSYLIIEEIEGVEPLDLQFGVHPRKTVPEALIEPLFGQPAPTAAEIAQYGSVEAIPPLKTYAILDAAKVPFLTSYLARSDLPHACLFKGKAAEDLQDVAPYLVELADDTTFTRNLFTKGTPAALWDKNPGIYIRSRAPFNDLYRHFRKFTRIQDEKGKWYYFRFYDPKTWKRVLYALEKESIQKMLSNHTILTCHKRTLIAKQKT